MANGIEPVSAIKEGRVSSREGSEVGRFRAANRHFKQASNIVGYDSFKAPFVGGLPRQIHPTVHPSYGHLYNLNLTIPRKPSFHE
jgi:hypothetical protein